MKYNDKLHLYFKSKDITQRELAKVLGYSSTMIGRYMSGVSEFGPLFIVKLIKHYPDIELNYIFSEELISNEVNDTRAPYEKEVDIAFRLQIIESNLSEIKNYLAQKCHKEK